MKSIFEYFLKTVALYSNNIAVDDCNVTYTFEQLKDIAYRIAFKIISDNFGTNHPIIIFFPKSSKEVASFLGVIFSGNFYVPIDIKQPDERIKKIIKVMDCRLIITERKYIDLLKNMGIDESQIIVYEDVISLEYNIKDVMEVQSRVIDTDPLYVKFTSGSSGEPKGVVLPHRAVMDYILSLNKIIPLSYGHICGNISPLHFDNSVHDVYEMILFGSRLILIPDHCMSFPVDLIELINRKNINVLWWPTSAIEYLANSNILDQVSMESKIEIITSVGQILQYKHYKRIFEYLNKPSFINLYGPTETAVASTYYIIPPNFQENESIPIGKPFPNTDVLVLNDDNVLVKGEEIGELCIRGTSLAGGYYNNPQKTAEVFVQNPLNHSYPELIYRTGDLVKYNKRGELIFLGRRDFQIKHRGNRIELGEIESVAINDIREISSCCTLYDYEKQKIIMFYTSHKELDKRELTKSLFRSLPKYMIPEEMIYLKVFPKNANDKIDRVLLKFIYESEYRD